MNQLAALAFDRDELRVLAIEWERGRLASFDPVDGSEQIERIFPVTNNRVWPRGRLRLQSRRPLAGGADAAGRDGGRGWDVALGRPPVVMLRGSAGLVSAVAFCPRRPVACIRGGRRADGTTDRHALGPGFRSANPKLRGGSEPGMDHRL